MSTGSLLPLCGGEHGPELLRREGGAAGTSARCGSGGWGSRRASRGPRRKSRPPCPRLPAWPLGRRRRGCPGSSTRSRALGSSPRSSRRARPLSSWWRGCA
ncbi:hypothetical protein ADJ70_07565 [Olsenella sp. oral taxon 807]|nr:hypothetical protein ADJ70_07565 [Olsenella sp. oral taxon 807]